MKAVATQNDCTINELMNLPAEDFLKCLCRIYASNYPIETEARLKSIQMASDDLAAETLLKFNEDWDFELMCCGEINGLPEKRLVKLYIEQLRPRQLSYNVKLTDPQKLTDAQKVAYEAAKMLRIVKQQAKYFQQSNDKLKHQAKG
jgi:hypothetical protein